MEVIHPYCAGIDVHKKFVVVCRMYTGPNGKLCDDIKTFSTMTKGLLELSDWLVEAEITHVAMESTGDYWKSVYNILEGTFEVWVVNANHVKNVPGRKTDVKDATWLCDLMRHGLMSPSFIPGPEQREWRDLTRMRLTLVRERSALCNRLHKALESCNIKVGSVASNLMGRSSRLMLEALVTKPEAKPEDIADLAIGALRDKRDDLIEALRGRMNDHHRFMIAQLLDHITDLDNRIALFEKRIDALNAPFRDAVKLLMTMPAVSATSANAVLSELGIDMSRFPTPGCAASWCGICPGNNESGGKRFSGKIRKGNNYLRVNLVQIAHVVIRMPGTQYYAMYKRIAPRRGKKRAIIAVAHALLVTMYSILKSGTPYVEPGPDYLKPADPQQQLQRLQKMADKLGFALTEKAPQIAA